MLLVFASCASTQVLTRAEARSLGERTWSGATDEVFDATWLTLARHGFSVSEVDRVAGTFTATREGRAWLVETAAAGSEQRVHVEPKEAQTTRGELSVLLDDLEAGTSTLLRAWRELPEWTYDGRRNLLVMPGFSAAPPRSWEWLDFDVSRRHVVVQEKKARTGVNATVLFELGRRRPEPVLGELLRRATGLTLGARQRLVFPDELRSRKDPAGLHGQLRVLDGTTPREVAWHALEAELGPVAVQVVMACPADQAEPCAALWDELSRSVVTRELRAAPR